MYKTEEEEFLEIYSVVFFNCHVVDRLWPIIDKSNLSVRDVNIFASFPSSESNSNWTSFDRAASWSFCIIDFLDSVFSWEINFG